MQLGAASKQTFERRRIELIVFRHHPSVGVMAGLLEDRFVSLRQRVPLVVIDEGQDHRAAFPPAGIIVVRRDLKEAELLVVIGADPFGGIDGALLERRIDVATRDLLRHGPELLQHASGESADAHLDALEILDRIDFLAEPTAHLAAGIAGEQRHAVVLCVELIQHFLAAAQRQPTLVQPLVRTERNRGAEGESRILAEIIIRGGVADFDGAVLYRVDDLKAGHDFAGGESLDLKLVVGRLGNRFRHYLTAAPQRVERLRPTGRHSPFELRHRLRDRRRGDCACGNAEAGGFQKLSTFHSFPPFGFYRGRLRMTPSVGVQPRGIVGTMAEPTG